MLIISQFKDYYDFLSGIYGVDPKLVLDRRIHEQPYFYGPQNITLLICGKIIEGFYDGESFYYGESLSKFGEIRKYYSRYHQSVVERSVFIKVVNGFSKYECRVNVDITDDPKNLNISENCPIMMGSLISSQFLRFPFLSKMSVGSALPPEEIYQMLVQWLSDRIKDSEVIVDNRNDVDKLLSKGFDKRESFRPNIKI